MAGRGVASGSAALVLVEGATPVRPEWTLFEAMLSGWRRQQVSRRLSPSLVEGRERVVRRFQEFTGGWPWGVDTRAGRVVHRRRWLGAFDGAVLYQGALSSFLGFATDPRYGWVAECEQRVGARPVQVCHEGNTAVHVDAEVRPAPRPLTAQSCRPSSTPPTTGWSRLAGAGGRGGCRRFGTPRCSRRSTGGGCAGGRR
ncbi:MAG: hypothetical protein ACXV5Q_07110 [Frankiaceae bacterium]